jgi:hypothetical protein
MTGEVTERHLINRWFMPFARRFGCVYPAIGPVASSGRPSLAALFCAGKRVVADDQSDGVDLRELAREARTAVRELLTEVA